jgi:DDE superfamily endonuclease
LLSLPPLFISFFNTFAPLFSDRVWRQAQVLRIGALLAPGKRTITSCLRMMGCRCDRHFVHDHGVLSRARWRGREASRLLLGLLVKRFVPTAPMVLGMDDTIERRRGKQMQARGIYRDPVRRSHSHCVKASGWRWVSLLLLAPVPWAARPWALPFLTCLAPRERSAQKRRKPHKPVLSWARQMIFQGQRWWPHRTLVVVGDSAFSALEWLPALVRQRLTVVTRWRWEAARSEPAPFRRPGTKGRPRKKGKRLPTLGQLLANKKTSWQRLTVPGW